MFRKILIATDGTKQANSAIAHGVNLAKACGASVVGFHARPAFPALYTGEPFAVTDETLDKYDRGTVAHAEASLAQIRAAAEKAKVGYKGLHMVSSSPADSIMRIAQREKCDLVVMSSHGRRGLKRALIGSETNYVLTHSKVPVLVTH